MSAPEAGVCLRDGQLQIDFAVAGYDPVPRREGLLHVEAGRITFYMIDSSWELGGATLFGYWANKDGRPGRRKGNIMTTSHEEDVPDWLAPRIAYWLGVLGGLSDAGYDQAHTGGAA